MKSFTYYLRLTNQCNINIKRNFWFVPSSNEPSNESIETLAQFLNTCKKLVVLTGAGVSTESGIPDYRSKGVGLYSRKSHRPMEYQVFLKSHDNRQRYWARNYVAWPIFSNKKPNVVHDILFKWEINERLYYLITQNVDNLHVKAGSSKLVELHGTTQQVHCIECDYRIFRKDFQNILKRLNQKFSMTVSNENVNPDGDVVLSDDVVKIFQYPDCPNCGGILKPDIVFFGDNVPLERRDKIIEIIDKSDGLLCLGTSLEVFSSFRIVKQAHSLNIPIGIVNIGNSRADDLVNYRISGRLGYVMSKIDEILMK